MDGDPRAIIVVRLVARVNKSPRPHEEKRDIKPPQDSPLEGQGIQIAQSIVSVGGNARVRHV